MNLPLQAAVRLYLAHSFKVIEREQRTAAEMVHRLELRTRDSLINHYGEANAWRGLCSDDLQTAFDLMKAFEAVAAQNLDITACLNREPNAARPGSSATDQPLVP